LKININLLESHYPGKSFLHDIIYIPEINSTNDYAKHFTQKDNLLIITDNQISGKGRFNRIWESEPDKNLTFSLKKSFDLEPANFQMVNFFFTGNTLKGINNYLKEEDIDPTKYLLELKWPNDILLDKKKLCGFLIESDVVKGSFIIGCGINVNQQKFNESYSFKTTSLINSFGREFDSTVLLMNILDEFNNNLYLLENHEFDKIFDSWMKNFNMIGKEIVYTDEKQFLGKAKIMDIRKDGGLQIFVNNEVKTIYSGDIRILYQN
jgi:BirA family biotin operon repressor/biotin-[acetyl-CoA-carboxylase] ligase